LDICYPNHTHITPISHPHNTHITSTSPTSLLHHITSTSHHHIHITSTSHPHHIFISTSSTSHLHHIYHNFITCTSPISYLHHTHITPTSHQDHMHITSISHPTSHLHHPPTMASPSCTITSDEGISSHPKELCCSPVDKRHHTIHIGCKHGLPNHQARPYKDPSISSKMFQHHLFQSSTTST
jgi:hypothetical protein